MTLLVANRSDPVIIEPYTQIIIAACPYGYTGLLGDYCVECPQGALCPGNEIGFDNTTALPGFYKESVATTDITCEIPRHGASEGACTSFIPCLPAEACLGNNE
jgi:hypothetical protein